MGDQVVRLVSRSHHEHLLDAMWNLRIAGNLCDITVQVNFQGELEEFEAHQLVLAATSGYFKSVFLAGEKVEKVFLDDIHPRVFIKFIEYVYSGKMEVQESSIGSILHMAKLLDCQDLVEACDTKLLDHDYECASAGQNKKWMRGKRQKSKKTLGKEMDQRQIGHSEREKKLQGRRSSRLAGQQFIMVISETDHRARPQMEVSDANLSQEQSEATQKELMERQKVCETPADVTADQSITDHETLSDSGSESAYAFIHEAHDDDTQETESILAEEMEETEADEREPKSEPTKFSCDKCSRSFRYEKSYLKHIRISHGVQTNTTYCCKVCQQTFANRCNLKIHERHVHNDERLYVCGTCGKAFKRKKDVTRHTRQVHEGGSGRVFCPVCGKSLSSKTALTLHIRTHTGDKPYSCKMCSARFSQSSALKTHQRTHTGEKPFACDLCNARFTQNHMLAYHKRSHTGEKPYMCENCGKNFASKEYLKHHARIHSGLKPYKCEKCGRAFAQRNSLHQHMKIHTGERPYQCVDCDKQFTQLNALQRHQRTHTGEKPYMCSMCKRTFTDKSTLRRHTSTHNKDTPWKNYLVVLQGNVEKPKNSSLKTDKAEEISDEQEALQQKKQPKVEEFEQEEPMTISAEWPTIAVVSHASLGNLTVIRTDIPPGSHLQPIVTTDGIPVAMPFSIPITVAQPIADTVPLAPTVPLNEPAASDEILTSAIATAPPVSTDTDSLLASVEETLSESTECNAEQSENPMEQNSESHEGTEHVRTTEMVEVVEIADVD